MTDITICGNTTAPAELRFIPSGKAVASFTVAVNERRFNKATNEWEDGDTTFYPCSAWGQMAENCAETLAVKGTRVVVTGRIKSRTFQNREGQDVVRFEVDVEEVGPSLRYATAKVTRTARGDQGHTQTRPAAPAPASDPWAGSYGEAPF